MSEFQLNEHESVWGYPDENGNFVLSGVCDSRENLSVEQYLRLARRASKEIGSHQTATE